MGIALSSSRPPSRRYCHVLSVNARDSAHIERVIGGAVFDM